MKLIVIAISSVLFWSRMACANPSVTATYVPLESGYRLYFVAQASRWNGTMVPHGSYLMSLAKPIPDIRLGRTV
jgi:ACR3 family arsenite efflux pump ArsB